MKHLLKCPKCARYTMKDKCPVCKHNTLAPQPPKYSPLDKYAKYRRMATLEERKKEDLL